MLQRLTEIERRFHELEQKSADPAVAANGQALASIMKEYRSLEPTVTAFGEYKSWQARADEAAVLLDDADEALAALAAEEQRACEAKLAELEETLRQLLLPRDPNDDRNVIVEIRAGAGGEEAALFAAVLYRMYTMFVASTGLRASLLYANETDLGGFKEVSFMVEGEGAFSKFKFESGVHRVQRVPTTESQGRIQTSTVTVAVLPEAEEIEIEINPADIVMESCKSSGAGGQHINKTESAVRLLHKPSGIVVECQEERSQFKNRDKAMKMLRARLFDIKQREADTARADNRKSQVGTGDRSERIRTYNYPQGRVTDHRIGLTLYTLEKILNGGMEELLEALRLAAAADKMQHADTALGDNGA